MKVQIVEQDALDKELSALFWDGMLTLQFNPSTGEIECSMTQACERYVERMGKRA